MKIEIKVDTLYEIDLNVTNGNGRYFIESANLENLMNQTENNVNNFSAINYFDKKESIITSIKTII